MLMSLPLGDRGWSVNVALSDLLRFYHLLNSVGEI